MLFVFFNDTATTEIYTLSLHDALPIFAIRWTRGGEKQIDSIKNARNARAVHDLDAAKQIKASLEGSDRKSTRLNSSHANISYAVFCLKKTKYRTDASIT